MKFYTKPKDMFWVYRNVKKKTIPEFELNDKTVDFVTEDTICVNGYYIKEIMEQECKKHFPVHVWEGLSKDHLCGKYYIMRI